MSSGESLHFRRPPGSGSGAYTYVLNPHAIGAEIRSKIGPEVSSSGKLNSKCHAQDWNTKASANCEPAKHAKAYCYPESHFLSHFNKK
jgi:hypothetical protein